MPITLAPELQTELEQTAQRLGKPAAEIAGEAIRTYLEELHAHALAQEEAAYARLYPRLARSYLHHFVAIYAGRVVDHDPDFETLFLRVQAQLGDRPVLLRRVDDTPHEEYTFYSPRLDATP